MPTAASRRLCIDGNRHVGWNEAGIEDRLLSRRASIVLSNADFRIVEQRERGTELGFHHNRLIHDCPR